MHINFRNYAIENQYKVKILGVIFDYKASRIPNILNLKNATSPRLNIIETFAHISWGA